MKSRAGSRCATLLLWLCALGAGSARQPVVVHGAVRGVVETALRSVAEGPQLAARVVVAVVATDRPVARHASHLAAPALDAVRSRDALASAPREALHLQSLAHARRPRWRTYDAVAPPRGSLVTPIAR